MLPTSHVCCEYQALAFCSGQRGGCATAMLVNEATAINATVMKTDLRLFIVGGSVRVYMLGVQACPRNGI